MIAEGQAALKDPVTLMVTRVPKPGRESEWEVLMSGGLRAARQFPGNLGATVLKPTGAGERAYRIIVSFDSFASLRQWEDSAQRLELVTQLESVESAPVLIEQAVGLETWFQLPANAGSPQPMIPPPRHKMMIASALGVYLTITPLLMVLRPVLDHLPLYVATMVLVPIAVVLLTYIVMPSITRLFRPWLYRERANL